MRYGCEFCGKQFNNKGHHRLHVRQKHTKEKPFKCSYCDKAFPSVDGITLHELSHRTKENMGYQCSICNMSFLRKTLLEKHKETAHSEQIVVKVEPFEIEDDEPEPEEPVDILGI